MANNDSVLLEGTNWRVLRFYHKSVALYQLTFVFCERFLPKHGDRTVDQMIQAARSGKQNIIEGAEDGKASTEMEIKLMNVARASLHELREDFRDYLLSRHLPLWDVHHPRYAAMRRYTATHNALEDYVPYLQRWDAEEMANVGYTLCCQTDVMMNGYLRTLEERFRQYGGMKERMYRLRTGQLDAQSEQIRQLKAEVQRLKAELEKKD